MPSYCDCVEQREGLLEVCFGLAGEADDDVRGDADGPAGGANPGDLFEILVARVSAPHGTQNARRAGLHRQMNVIAERGNFVDGIDDLAVEIVRMRGGEAHAADARHLGDGAQQVREIPARAATDRGSN